MPLEEGWGMEEETGENSRGQSVLGLDLILSLKGCGEAPLKCFKQGNGSGNTGYKAV